MQDVVVTGANGWIGGRVGSLLEKRGLRVIGVSRQPEQAREKRPQWRWIGTGPELEEAVERAGVVVNLAGRHPVEQPWTPEFVAEMRASRIRTTARIAAALRRSPLPDRVLVSGSGALGYGDTGENSVTEDDDFGRELVLGDMEVDWEAAASPVAEAGVRLVILRLGVVLGPDAGAFPMLRAPFDDGAGVVLGTGRQWVPWVHIDDTAQLIADAVLDPAYRGPLNVVAPHPARYAEIIAAIGEVLGVPQANVVPAEQVTRMLGRAAEMVLTSQRLVPRRAVAAGFEFRYPDLAAAVKQILTDPGPASEGAGNGR
jgi:uncharacterized protein (TIGR01777 family)